LILNRTFLFVPANHLHRVSKALSTEVDAVILDLEDAVAVSEKAQARSLIQTTLQKPRFARAYVRSNAVDTQHFNADVQECVHLGLDGIVLPMLQRPEDLAIADWLITQWERERGLVAGSIDLIPIIETAAGIARVEAIADAAARLSRVRRLALGAGDLSLDLGMTLTSHESELLAHRSRLAVASRVAGLEAPLDTVFGNVRDSEGCKASARRASELGFQGKMCIHPDQCAIVEEAFAPSAEALSRARTIVAEFEAAEREGVASIASAGQLIDYPIYLRAQLVLQSQRGRPTSTT
jgi:citrate lyase subunit beta / citryl-CoA lyase